MAGRLYLLSLSSSFRDFLTEYTTNAALNRCQFRDGEKVVIHRFKVTGENTFLLVVQESGQNTVDSLVHQRLPGQLTVNSCTPLLDYETFANSLDVEIPEGTPLKLENGKFHWLEVTIDFPGKTVEDLLNVWKDEAALTVKAQRTTPMAVYKVVAERKVHVFNGSAPEHVDKVSFKLPITAALGSSVSIRTKAVERF